MPEWKRFKATESPRYAGYSTARRQAIAITPERRTPLPFSGPRRRLLVSSTSNFEAQRSTRLQRSGSIVRTPRTTEKQYPRESRQPNMTPSSSSFIPLPSSLFSMTRRSQVLITHHAPLLSIRRLRFPHERLVCQRRQIKHDHPHPHHPHFLTKCTWAPVPKLLGWVAGLCVGDIASLVAWAGKVGELMCS